MADDGRPDRRFYSSPPPRNEDAFQGGFGGGSWTELKQTLDSVRAALQQSLSARWTLFQLELKQSANALAATAAAFAFIVLLALGAWGCIVAGLAWAGVAAGLHPLLVAFGLAALQLLGAWLLLRGARARVSEAVRFDATRRSFAALRSTAAGSDAPADTPQPPQQHPI